MPPGSTATPGLPAPGDVATPATPATTPAPAPATTTPTNPENLRTGQEGETITPATADEDFVNPWTPGDAPKHAPQWEGFTMEELKESPDYQFRLAEGERAIRRQAAAKGQLHSGSTLKALERYRQRLAAEEFDRGRARSLEDYRIKMGEFQYGRSRGQQDYQLAQQDYQLGIQEADAARARSLQQYLTEAANVDDFFNRLMKLSGQGGGTTNNLIQVGTQLLNQQANAVGQGANARAGGMLGQANANVMTQLGGGNQPGFNNILSGIGALGSIFQMIYG